MSSKSSGKKPATPRHAAQKKSLRNNEKATIAQSPTKKQLCAEGNREQLEYVTTDGGVSNKNIMPRIYEFLSSSTRPKSSDEFKKAIGINMNDPRNKYFLDCMNNNPSYVVDEERDGLYFSLARPYGVVNRWSLRCLLLCKIPNGEHTKPDVQGAVLGVPERELRGTYAQVEIDIDDMLVDGEIVCTSKSDHKGAERVFFPSPAGSPAQQCIKSIWHSIELPLKRDLQKELIKSGLRTINEYRAREQRFKDIRDEELQLQERLQKEEKDARREARREAKKEQMMDDYRKAQDAAFNEDVFKSNPQKADECKSALLDDEVKDSATCEKKISLVDIDEEWAKMRAYAESV